MFEKNQCLVNDTIWEEHEIRAVRFLRFHGYEIQMLSPSKTQRVRTPDLHMNGLDWELKSPRVGKKSSLEHIFRKAAKQSVNIIIDLSSISGDEQQHIKTLNYLFTHSRRVKKLLVITQSGQIITLDK